MLKSLVSPRNNSSTEHIEAVQAERDFFREKYAAQMNEMEDLRNQLKESQRVIDRLRRQVLELEMGKDAAAAAVVVGGESVNVDGSEETPKKIANGSSSTSLTSMIQEEDSIQSSSAADETKAVNEQSTSDAEQEEGEDKEDDDEADQIRANAERLLQWSDYQSRRSTLSPSNTPSNNDDKSRSFIFDTTNDTSSTRHDSSSESTRSNSNCGNEQQQHSPSPNKMEYSSINSTSKQGKMTTFLNGLKDIIDPPLDDYDGTDSEEDEDDNRDESSDEESSIDHRSLDG